MLSVSSLLQSSFDLELLAELCLGSRVSFPSCPLVLSPPLRPSVVRVPLLLLSVITYRGYTWMSTVLGQATVINYNGQGIFLTHLFQRSHWYYQWLHCCNHHSTRSCWRKCAWAQGFYFHHVRWRFHLYCNHRWSGCHSYSYLWSRIEFIHEWVQC